MLFSPIRGGVHPDSFKELSSALPIARVSIPRQLYIPLRQHAGSDAVPVVRVNDQVLKGQLIARAGEGLSAPVHAPTSGVISFIGPIIAAHPSGMKASGIVIDTDLKDTPVTQTVDANPFERSPEALAASIAEAGIVGMGGAAFPAAVKLTKASASPIETLIINGGECEPYLTADDRLMRERAKKVVLGARLIRYIAGVKRIAIAIEDNKREAITAMDNASRDYDYIDIKVVPSRYPMGSAKQLIQAITRREVPAGGRSSDIGVLMHNVATACAIAECLTEYKPLISRIVTVSGGAIVRPQNLEALIGTPVRHLIEHCGGLTENPARLILGGPMMGQVMPSQDVPLIKGAAGVLALLENEITRKTESPCIRCSRCVSACPMGLLPLEMSIHARAQEFEAANDYGLKDCILCGSCAYVCPSHIPLVHYFQYAKGELSYSRAKQQRAEYTRSLSEAKRLRKEKEAAEKAAAKAAAKAKRKKRAVKAPAET